MTIKLFSMFEFLFLSVIAILLLNGCATTLSQSAARVINADMTMISNCQFLGDVHGWSGWGNNATSLGLKNAENQAREKAASMGATHIFWTIDATGLITKVSGKAYLCK